MAFEQVRLIYPVPSGGHVEVTDSTLVPMGGEVTYAQLTYTNGGCEIVFEVRDGVPGAVSVKLMAGRTHLRAKDLMAIKLDHLCHEAFAVAGVFEPTIDGEMVGELTPRLVRKVIDSSRRRKITPEFLKRIAKVHNSSPAGKRVEAISAAFDVSDRQAWRYIAQAREKGFIDGDR